MSSEVELYPKIETVFDRDPKTFKVMEDKIRLPEFANVKKWWVTEKIDGTNCRISYIPNIPAEGYVANVLFHGRTENAQIPTFLFEYLQKTFTIDKFKKASPNLNEKAILYGEGYGAKIQKGGNYRPHDISFRLFDVKIGDWWLEPENIEDIAQKFCIKIVPKLGVMTFELAVRFVKGDAFAQIPFAYNNEHRAISIAALEEGGNPTYPMEGIVARSIPLMLRRNGKDRIMWKLKVKDFP